MVTGDPSFQKGGEGRVGGGKAGEGGYAAGMRDGRPSWGGAGRFWSRPCAIMRGG